MGLLSSVTDALGLTTDPQKAADMAQFNPMNIQSAYGGVNYDPSTRTFNSSLEGPWDTARYGLFDIYSQGADPNAYLSLLRQRAAPQNQQMMQGLENRLFSQGRLDFSPEYRPGGAMRGLFDAIQQQDLDFQLGADQWQMARQQGLLNQIGYFDALENSLFAPAQGMGALQVQAGGNVGSLYAGQSQFNNAMTNTIFENIAGGFMGGMIGGGFFG